ncbi:MAG TPA: sugar ABC transporter permease [Kineosporiaceae bacterium]|nr:sugar ABC transporter permease [Kineosporiaceae bacterium]
MGGAATLFLLSPATALFVIFVVVPVTGTLVLSCADWDLLGRPRFVGLANFSRLLSDPAAVRALVNTALFSAASIALHLSFGLVLAFAVQNQVNRHVARWLEAAIVAPFLLSWAATAVIWRYAYDPNFGLVSYYGAALHLPAAPLASPQWALPALVLVDLWHTLGFSFLVLAASLRALPQDVVEAARVDGASSWQSLRHILLPLLSPTLTMLAAVNLVGAFQIFEPMFLMTRGGPGLATLSAVEIIYETAFGDLELGYAAAMSVALAVLVLVGGLLQVFRARRMRRSW